ncbi:MAG TPA: copper chaperone PCu(A)C [Hellea balneolensis]|uniref:Copper chaperone PCu(A)C n=1 Tax=Hellea balneolensis TaxID=287478 RepID=A0A7C5QZP3_9PROT|nr:copper chaperone PCu(A)C [Hellea balneolensis]
MIKKTLIIPTLVFLAALVAATLYLYSGGESKHAPAITIENARIRPPLPGQTTAIGWFDIVNAGAVDELLSASSPISDKIELHTHTMTGGIMKMRQVKTVRINGETTTEFKPGGLHIMIFNANIAPDAQHVPLTLSFARSGDMKVTAKIVE